MRTQGVKKIDRAWERIGSCCLFVRKTLCPSNDILLKKKYLWRLRMHIIYLWINVNYIFIDCGNENNHKKKHSQNVEQKNVLNQCTPILIHQRNLGRRRTYRTIALHEKLRVNQQAATLCGCQIVWCLCSFRRYMPLLKRHLLWYCIGIWAISVENEVLPANWIPFYFKT